MARQSQTMHGSEEDVVVQRVSIPVSLLGKIVEAARAFEALEDELEDYLLSQDAAFMARMRQARAHHVEGEARPLDALRHELRVEQTPRSSLTRISETSSAKPPTTPFAT
ncbi:MAG TPA: hypothetical protein VM075_01680 [Anaerolineae bacterium]|nr:hypothetical protein [Anaerolineae bacterium]